MNMAQRVFHPAILIEERNTCFVHRQTTSRWVSDRSFQGGYWGESFDGSIFSYCWSIRTNRTPLFTIDNCIFGTIDKRIAGLRAKR